MAAERMQKINELVRERVSEIISRDIDLSPDVFVTITTVDTSRDLKHSTVYVTVIPDGKRLSVVRDLQARAGRIQKELGSKITIKFTPRLTFKLDEGAIHAQHIYDILDSKNSKS
ncbi:MAG: 30S ribosome-binding factor RbfA [Candidatus Kerfeldbacteria bacterium]